MEKYVKQYQNNIERREKLPKTTLESQNHLKPLFQRRKWILLISSFPWICILPGFAWLVLEKPDICGTRSCWCLTFLTGQVRNPAYAYTDHGNNSEISGQARSGVGGILFQYLARPSGGDSDLRNWFSITKLLFYHSFHFYPPKEAPIPFGNITIGFSSSPRF